MASSSNTFDVYLEIGQKRTFACAVDWPGWSRSGRDTQAALDALASYGPRYARVLHAAHIPFEPPAGAAVFSVTEELQGNATTDFGAPNATPSSDTQPLGEYELYRMERLLQAYWGAFDVAVSMATGKELRKGPRGGGRDLAGIIQHVLEADRSDLARLAWKYKQPPVPPREQLGRIRQAILHALDAAAHGQLPASGPRGGVIWTPHQFVRRSAWHVLDHVWEIKDRVM